MNTPKKTRIAIVASLPRTASTLMCEAIAQHPAALGCGEIFLHEDTGRAYYHKKAVGDLRFYPGPEKFAAYLDYLLAVAALEGRDLLACKLMDYQEPLAWELIAASPELPIVHTRRENVLACLASSLASVQSGAWHGHDETELQKASGVVVMVPPAELEEWHARKLAFDARLAALPNPRLAVEYAELSNDYAATVARTYAFLGLAPFCAVPTQKKLNPRPLRERVANFDALAAHFARTDLAPYFATTF